jgi:hypothetical protein
MVDAGPWMLARLYFPSGTLFNWAGRRSRLHQRYSEEQSSVLLTAISNKQPDRTPQTHLFIRPESMYRKGLTVNPRSDDICSILNIIEKPIRPMFPTVGGP